MAEFGSGIYGGPRSERQGMKGQVTKNYNSPNAAYHKGEKDYHNPQMVTSGSVSNVERQSKPVPMSSTGYEQEYRKMCMDAQRQFKSQMAPYDSMKRKNY